MTPRAKRFARAAFITLAAILVLVAAGAYGIRTAGKVLKAQIEEALGPSSEVGSITLDWSTVVIRDLRVKAPAGWPAEHTLRAETITVLPDLRGWLRDRSRITVSQVTIENAYLSAYRARDGKLKLLPGIAGGAKGKAQAASVDSEPMQVMLGNIVLNGGTIELFDASVRQPAHKIRLQDLRASMKQLHVPSLSGRSELKLDATLIGPRHNGKISIAGWLELAARNSQLTTRIQGVDLVALQPYLIRAAETGVKRGTLDMNLQSIVRNNQLRAPGTITLSDLELAERGATFMSLPRRAVVAGMKDNNNRITVQFVLSGDLSDPKFSLNDSFARSVGAAAAGLLGISIEGLGKSLGGAAEGVGSVVKKLFGK